MRPYRAVGVTLAVLMLTACGQSEEKKTATQVAAKVNKEEISVHQVNNVLQRTPNVRPEQAKQAAKQILDRLVEQELLVQQAHDKKLDRDPKVMQAIEAARREVLARAYIEQVTGSLAKPTATEIAEFYEKRPELFKERRIYNMRELAIGMGADSLPKLQEQMEKAKSFTDVAEWLRSQNIPFTTNISTKSAEQLPMELVGRFHQMKEGQTALIPTPNAILIVQLVASQSQPLDDKQAAPFIEQFLVNQRKAEAAANEVKTLKAKATIEYMGEFAKNSTETKAVEANAPQPAAPPAAAPAAPAPAGKPSEFEKGIKGLK